MGTSGRAITDEQRATFIKHLSEMPNVSRAARLAGFASRTAYFFKDNEPDFKLAWDAAMADSLERMEAIVHQRAFEGVAKPLTHQGQLTYQRDYSATEIDPETGQTRFVHPSEAPLKRDADGNLIPVTVPEVSDSLAMFMLKAHLPDKYRERSEVSVNGTIDIASAIHAARKRSGTTP
jgi:hypothetical protein